MELNQQRKQEHMPHLQETGSIKEKAEQRELFLGEWSFRKILGVFTIAAFALSLLFTPVYTSDKAVEIVTNRTTLEVSSGDVLFQDESNAGIQAKDFEVQGIDDGSGNAKMLIWDYNLEDQDKVQVFINGKPVREPFVLTNSPVAISVPATGIVTVQGIKDSGGGISYAVKFPQNKMTIFNVVTVGGVNTYHLVPKP